MLVYGDQREFADPREWLERVSERLASVAGMPAGIGRHAQLVGALIETGQIVQGGADEGCNVGPLNQFLAELATSVIRSWDSSYRDIGALPRVPRVELPDRVELRTPEGFAFYAVYPEFYAVAAARLHLSGAPRVIGIRSIGTTLGAVVAAALGAPPPVTVRPFGDPFARKVELPPEIIKPDAHYVIVDEGPGLSGSSFGAAADWLEERGVPLHRIAFLPSHGGGLGPQASESHRERWSRAQLAPAEFNPEFLIAAFGQLEEFSTGRPWERLKFIARQGGERVLLKFAGLGAMGDRKLRMARALHAAGLGAEPVALVHGFLAERWCGDATPLVSGDKPVEEIARYLGTRARLFPAKREEGASLELLLEMCRRNVSVAFGDEAATPLDRWSGELEKLSRRVVRVRTDNKLDRHEWLRAADGRLLKTDAVDHHAAHDLIGCQDLAWDVAGGIVEFALDEADAGRLVLETERAAGRCIDRELLSFYREAYCCFRLGQAKLVADSDVVARYARAVRHLLLQRDPLGTRQESSVG